MAKKDEGMDLFEWSKIKWNTIEVPNERGTYRTHYNGFDYFFKIEDGALVFTGSFEDWSGQSLNTDRQNMILRYVPAAKKQAEDELKKRGIL